MDSSSASALTIRGKGVTKTIFLHTRSPFAVASFQTVRVQVIEMVHFVVPFVAFVQWPLACNKDSVVVTHN